MSVRGLWKISLADGNWPQLRDNYIRLDVLDFAATLSELMMEDYFLAQQMSHRRKSVVHNE